MEISLVSMLCLFITVPLCSFDLHFCVSWCNAWLSLHHLFLVHEGGQDLFVASWQVLLLDLC